MGGWVGGCVDRERERRVGGEGGGRGQYGRLGWSGRVGGGLTIT